MLPKHHIFLGILFILILSLTNLFTPLQLILILAASILIDTDHWFVYVKRKKDFSIKQAYNFFYSLRKTKSKHTFLCIFHTIEFFIILGLLSLKSQFFFLVFLGCIFHLVTDIFGAIFMEQRWGKKISLICALIKK